MNYYKNEQGIDIREWFMKEMPKEWIVISMFNALKYRVRAGLKYGNTTEQDYKKMDNYMDDYINLTGMSAKDAYILLDNMEKKFKNYDN